MFYFYRIMIFDCESTIFILWLYCDGETDSLMYHDWYITVALTMVDLQPLYLIPTTIDHPVSDITRD